MARRRAAGSAGERGVVLVGVVPDEGRVDDRHPPDGLADHRERLRLVVRPDLAEPLRGVPHGGDSPAQRARSGGLGAAPLVRPVLAAPLLLVPGRHAPVLAVPGHPAAGRAEARVLALRLELLAAALTSPSFRHLVMLRVTFGRTQAGWWNIRGTSGSGRATSSRPPGRATPVPPSPRGPLYARGEPHRAARLRTRPTQLLRVIRCAGNLGRSVHLSPRSREYFDCRHGARRLMINT